MTYHPAERVYYALEKAIRETPNREVPTYEHWKRIESLWHEWRQYEAAKKQKAL